jgi:hypothetical protein
MMYVSVHKTPMNFFYHVDGRMIAVEDNGPVLPDE